MSELIDNRAKRLEELKGIIMELHRGVPVEEVRERFQDLIRGVEYDEVTAMEQALMEDGMPVEEIMKLCDAHAAVFQEELESRERPEMMPGHPVHTMRAENDAILGAVNRFRDALASGKPPEELKPLVDELLQVDRHYVRKENILFPYLEAKGIYGPPKVMWGIHDEIRAGLKDIAASLDAGRLPEADLADNTLESMVQMVQKENNILIPMLLENLSDEEWAKVLAQEKDVGYTLVTPGGEWRGGQEQAGEAGGNVPAETGDMIRLNTGSLTREEIDLMLRHLPFDVTYVDENDRVRYYSEGDRIFPRSPAIIGREVQNCHPPASVHVVNRIVEEFKKGSRDVAEFWIQMKGRFLHIRYFAVRDASGNYRGVVEVSQDITDIRNLDGEKRLLDWE